MTGKTERELITRTEYARRRGVAPRTIGKYCQKEIIPLHDNKIDPVEADACLEEFLAEPLGSGRNGSSIGSYTAARTEEKMLKIELLELDLQLKKGETVLVKDVEYAAFTAARDVRDKMLNIPDRICAIVAAETDEVKVREIIMKQIENELQSVVEGKFNPESLTD